MGDRSCELSTPENLSDPLTAVGGLERLSVSRSTELRPARQIALVSEKQESNFNDPAIDVGQSPMRIGNYLRQSAVLDPWSVGRCAKRTYPALAL